LLGECDESEINQMITELFGGGAGLERNASAALRHKLMMLFVALPVTT